MAKRPVNLPTKRPLRSEDPVGAYAFDVCTGKIVACRNVRLACERHFRDLQYGARRGLVFSRAWALHALKFFPGYLHHSKGEWGGQAFELEPWQEFIVGSAFGWFRKDGTRRFRTVYIEIARKNGKSQLCAGIGIYGLVADREPGAEVYAAATRRDQARIIFNEAQRMVRTSPELTRHVSAFKFNMSVDRTASKFEPLSSDDRTLDGLNPHFVLIDELHKHRSRAVLDVLNSALGARRSPMIWIITTAGDDNPESVYASENAHAIRVVERTVEDDSYLSFVCTLDQDDEWSDPRVWIKANPNLGISVKLDELKRLALKAKSSPPSLTSFRRLNLNVRTSDATRAIDMDQWRRNTDGPFDPAEMHGRRFFGALDLSSKIDLSCWLKLFPPIEDEKRWKVVPRFWLPSETVAERSDRDRVQYQRWIDAGFIEVTMGNAIDHNEVEQAIREDCRLHEAASIAYDPWNAYQLASSLDMDGVPVIEFVQGLRSYSAPTKELMAWLAEGKIDHGGNPVLAWMAANLHTQVDKNLNVMPTKKHSIGRIDGMTSLIMAIGRVMLDEGPSVYETRGLLAL